MPPISLLHLLKLKIMKKTELLEKLHTIKNQGITALVSVDEMINLLEAMEEGGISEETIDEIADNVADSINNEDVSIIDDYSLDMNGREVELSSIDFDKSSIMDIVRETIKEAIN
jgi:hypothetical protein